MGGIILDPFSGSATTGKMTLMLSRKCIGHKLNSEFYDLGIKDLREAIKSFDKKQTEKISLSSQIIIIIKKNQNGIVYERFYSCR